MNPLPWIGQKSKKRDDFNKNIRGGLAQEADGVLGDSSALLTPY